MDGGYLEQIKDLVLEFMKDEPATIFLFGSMAGENGHPGSDVDVGLLPRDGFNADKLTLLKEKIEELNIPYKVELVDFRHVSETFRKEALKNAVFRNSLQTPALKPSMARAENPPSPPPFIPRRQNRLPIFT